MSLLTILGIWPISFFFLCCHLFVFGNLVVMQEELENFPLTTIHLSQTVLNQTRYPSVLLLMCQDQDQHRPDIHFFHCDQVEVGQRVDLTNLKYLVNCSGVLERLYIVCFTHSSGFIGAFDQISVMCVSK